MSDHASSPRAFADPVIDITDMYAFPSPEHEGALVLVLNVFPFAGMSALFSDAVEYRFRIRPAAMPSGKGASSFAVSEKEYTVSCRFAAPVTRDGGVRVQDGSCITSNGTYVSFQLNDQQGGEVNGMRAYAGVRMDPFFFDGVKALETIMTGKLSFVAKGSATVFRQNVLSIVIELHIAKIFEHGDGPLFAVVGETLTTGSLKFRLERFGRAEIKNFLLLPKGFDKVNRDIELRDLYNEEDAFKPRPAYGAAYRARFNANLAFWDGLDGKTDWLPDPHGGHRLTEFLMADFMAVDVSKPFAEDSYLEIERRVLKGEQHHTCGGRWLNDDSIDTLLTLLINAGNGARISDGVDQATVPASRTFPYLAPPEPNPPPPKAPPIVAR
jgi:Domain of unknown function (DUF4331)